MRTAGIELEQISLNPLHAVGSGIVQSAPAAPVLIARVRVAPAAFVRLLFSTLSRFLLVCFEIHVLVSNTQF